MGGEVIPNGLKPSVECLNATAHICHMNIPRLEVGPKKIRNCTSYLYIKHNILGYSLIRKMASQYTLRAQHKRDWIRCIWASGPGRLACNETQNEQYNKCCLGKSTEDPASPWPSISKNSSTSPCTADSMESASYCLPLDSKDFMHGFGSGIWSQKWAANFQHIGICRSPAKCKSCIQERK